MLPYHYTTMQQGLPGTIAMYSTTQQAWWTHAKSAGHWAHHAAKVAQQSRTIFLGKHKLVAFTHIIIVLWSKLINLGILYKLVDVFFCIGLRDRVVNSQIEKKHTQACSEFELGFNC